MIKILLADDHAVVRRGLQEILVAEFKRVVWGEAQNAPQVLDLVRKQGWDLVVLDLHMPGRGGLEVLRELKQERPKLPVLVLSMYPEDQFAVRAFKAGAAGYLTKESAPEELVNAVRKILGDRKYISPSLAETLAASLAAGTEKPRHELLSDREYLVMCRIASGKTVKEIATELSLSVKTISTYRSRILEKIGM